MVVEFGLVAVKATSAVLNADYWSSVPIALQ